MLSIFEYISAYFDKFEHHMPDKIGNGKWSI